MTNTIGGPLAETSVATDLWHTGRVNTVTFSPTTIASGSGASLGMLYHPPMERE